MDRRFIVLSLVIGVAANVVYGLLAHLTQIPSSVEVVVIVVLLLVVPFLALQVGQFWQRGLRQIWRAEDHKFDLLRRIQEAKKALYFIGVSARTIMQPQVEAALVQKLLTHHEFEVRFLLFDRTEAVKLRRRALEETGSPDAASEWMEAMASTVGMILRIKKTLGPSGNRLQVRTYKSFPVFRMLIIDNRHVLMNYYAKERFPSDLPCLELGGAQDPSSFGYAFAKYFEEMWLDASEAIPQPDSPASSGAAVEPH